MPAKTDKIAAILLAAGMSRRMGSPKALLDIGGKPLIARLLETAGQVPAIERTIVVTGHEPQRIQQAVPAQFHVEFVHNPAYQTGEMLSSIQTGAATIQHACDAMFILLLDQPLILPSTLIAMVKAWQEQRPSVIIPTHDRRSGHPILLDQRCIAQLLSLPTGSSLRDLVVAAKNEDGVLMVEAGNDPGVVTDIDTPEDYQLLLKLWRERNPAGA